MLNLALSFLVGKAKEQPGKFYSFVSILTEIMLTVRIIGWLFKSLKNCFNGLILSSTASCLPRGVSYKVDLHETKLVYQLNEIILSCEFFLKAEVRKLYLRNGETSLAG